MDRLGNSQWRKIRATLKRQHQAAGTPCGICGQTIEFDAPATHPAAYQLDHIVPLSRGGHPYEHHNLQPVHRYCNRLKSNKPGVPVRAQNRMQRY